MLMTLGYVMLHHRITKESYSYVLARMKEKISNHKTSYLSFVGVITLAHIISCKHSWVHHANCRDCDDVKPFCDHIIKIDHWSKFLVWKLLLGSNRIYRLMIRHGSNVGAMGSTDPTLPPLAYCTFNLKFDIYTI